MVGVRLLVLRAVDWRWRIVDALVEFGVTPRDHDGLA